MLVRSGVLASALLVGIHAPAGASNASGACEAMADLFAASLTLVGSVNEGFKIANEAQHQAALKLMETGSSLPGFDEILGNMTASNEGRNQAQIGFTAMIKALTTLRLATAAQCDG